MATCGGTPAAASNKPLWDTVAVLVTRCTARAARCPLELRYSPIAIATELDALSTDDQHVEVEATYRVHQQMITAYRQPDPVKGRALMVKLIRSLSGGVPSVLTEVISLGQTLKKRAVDILAYFDHPELQTAPPKPSTAASNTHEDHPSGSATSPTMSHTACWKPVDSDPPYTPVYEEPPMGARTRRPTGQDFRPER